MPATSSRYQSRLFSVLAEQSQRWSDRVAVAFRQVKVATVWGLQAIAYPVYALFKVTGLLGTKAPSPTAALPNEPVEVDTPIHRLVAEVKTWEFSSAQVSAATPPAKASVHFFRVFKNWFFPQPTVSVSPTLQALPAKIAEPIRGIANLIPERTLALVGDRNQILDILTLPQQAQLEQRIIEEVGNYWQAQPTPPILPAATPATLPPWVNNKPIAHALDLLKNVTLHPQSNPSVFPTAATPTPSHLPTVNTEAAALPSAELPTLQTWKDALLSQVQDFARSLAEELDADLAALHQEAIENPALSQTCQSEAIADPWFAENGFTAHEVESTAIAPAVNSLEHLVKYKALPAAQTFGKTVQTSTKKLIRESLSFLPGLEIASSEEAKIIRQIQADIQETSSTWKEAVETQVAAISEAIDRVAPLETIRTSAAAIVEQLSPQVSSSQSSRSEENAEEWIETKATTVEYVKHPLEKMLGWLDRFMFWIEEQVVRLWNWVKQLKIKN